MDVPTVATEKSLGLLTIFGTKVCSRKGFHCSFVSSHPHHLHTDTILFEGTRPKHLFRPKPINLDSTNGIRVDGKPCRKHLMRPHATLTMGSASFELNYRPLEMGAIGITPPTDPF